MRTLHTLILSGTLTPCESASQKILIKIDTLQISISKQKTSSPPQNQSNIFYIYHRNKYTVKQLHCYLKKEFLNNIDVETIFDPESQTHVVYKSLSKLEKIQSVNDFYLKDLNIAGLQKLSSELNSLLCD